MKRSLLPDYLILSFAWNVADVLRLCENVYSVKLPCCNNITIMSAALIPDTLSNFFFFAGVLNPSQDEDDIGRRAEKETDSVGELTVYSALLSCITSFCSPFIIERVMGNKGGSKSLTGMFFLLAAPMGSCIEQHLLHLLQLLLHTVEVEVGALLRHGGKVCRSSGRQWLAYISHKKDDSAAEPGKQGCPDHIFLVLIQSFILA